MLLVCVFLYLSVTFVLPNDDEHISCTGENNDVISSVCGSKQSHSCQAVSDMGLNVTCSRCPPGIEAEWKVDNITQVATSRTLVLRASGLKPGCYTCECLNSTGSTGMTYNVTVSDREIPKFEVCHHKFKHAIENNSYIFCPNLWNIVLHKNESGVKCVNATAAGYPNPQYSWSYSTVRGQWHDVSHDPCLEIRENGKLLCITPTVHNAKDSERMYRCTVRNTGIAGPGKIRGHQRVTMDIRDWMIHDYPDMNKGTIHLSGGKASGEVAVYDDGVSSLSVTYIMCFVESTDIMKTIASVNISDLACTLKNPHYSSFWGSCCQCGDDDCARSGSYSSKIEQGDDVTTSSICRFWTNKTGHFIFFGQRNSENTVVYQYLGSLSIENPEIVFSLLQFVSSVGGAFFAGALVFSILLLTLCCCQKRIRRCCAKRCCQNEPPGGNERDRVNGGDRRNYRTLRQDQDAVDPEIRPVVRLINRDIEHEPVIDIPNDKLNIGSDSLDINLDTSQLSSAPSMYCLKIVFAGKTITVQMNLSKTRVDHSLTRSCEIGEAVTREVKLMHEHLTRNLNIDAPLLAAMSEKGLLSQVDFEKLQAELNKGSSRCDIASYFISNILLRWAPGVFVGQLELFRDALANHDDRSNNRFAEEFTKILKAHVSSPEE